MGATLEEDLHKVIRHGVATAFPSLTALRSLRYYHAHAVDDSPGVGAKVIRQLLTTAAAEFDPGPRSEAIKALLAVKKEKRKLNGPDGLRQAAGDYFGVGWDQFSRTLEKPLVADFAVFVETWDRGQREPGGQPLRFTWDDIHATADRMYRQLEQQFAPDVVVTMAGPGSFAAIYTMRLNPRDVPVVVAVTFPKREEAMTGELQFRAAATANGWTGFSTPKWSVFVPDVIFCYPKGSRVVILDDRVITGESQALLHRMLTEAGMDARCAALFAPKETQVKDLIVGRYVEGTFDMPWGPSRGREAWKA
ncbi:MAG: hypothetical protein M3O70_25625 [Actinomycetota bacterium]|nr:hypothetical protein [Actinomycetota bacterium]